MRIILAIDGSECSTYAVQAAKEMQFPVGTELKVICALDFSEPLPPIAEVKKRERVRAQDLIHGAVLALKKIHPDAEITGELQFGYAADKILQASRDWLADLIIVGSHERNGLDRFLPGSVSRAVLLHAPCAVRIVRCANELATQSDQVNVLIAVDESDQAKHLVDHVTSLPWRCGTKFRCVSVVKDLGDDIYVDLDSNLTKTIGEQQADLLQRHRGSALDAARRINRMYDQEVATAEVVGGGPLEKILEIAKTWPADIVMLASHGRRGLDKLLMGSVSEGVALHAECSVEVTRSPALRKKVVQQISA